MKNMKSRRECRFLRHMPGVLLALSPEVREKDAAGPPRLSVKLQSSGTPEVVPLKKRSTNRQRLNSGLHICW